jgi:hypothetical protein
MQYIEYSRPGSRGQKQSYGLALFTNTRENNLGPYYIQCLQIAPRDDADDILFPTLGDMKRLIPSDNPGLNANFRTIICR